MKLPENPVTVEDLKVALEGDDYLARARIFDRYSKRKPDLESLPFLCTALAEEYPWTGRSAAKSLRKLGPAAVDAMDDLMTAATRLQPGLTLPQLYPECVEAMAAIQPSHPELVQLIKHSIGYTNWVPLSASLRALKTIGTPEALDLLHRTAKFWEPELNKMQLRVVRQLLES